MTELPEPEQTDKPAPYGYPYGPQRAVIPERAPPPWPVEQAGPLQEPPPFVPEILVVGGCLMFNFLAPLIISGLRPEPILVIAVACGAIAAEVAGLCAVLVFGESRFLVRFIIAWLIGYSLMIAFLLGIAVAQPRSSDIGEGLRVLFCGLPLVALAAQLPLWAARLYFGWRIERPCGDANPPRPLSIGDILCGTAIAALTVAAVRFVPDASARPDPDFWLGWAIAVPAIAGISLISVLPAIYLGLRVEKQGAGCAILAIYAVVAAVLTIFGISILAQRAPPGEMLVVFPVMIGTFAAALWGLACLLRWRGYRLVFAGEQWATEVRGVS